LTGLGATAIATAINAVVDNQVDYLTVVLSAAGGVIGLAAAAFAVNLLRAPALIAADQSVASRATHEAAEAMIRALMTERDAARAELQQAHQRPVSAKHLAELKGLLGRAEHDIEGLRPLDLPAPQDALHERMLRAHFPDIVEELDRWTAAVDALHTAPTALRGRFQHELHARGLDGGGYHADVIAGRFTDIVAAQAINGALGSPLPLGELWNCWEVPDDLTRWSVVVGTGRSEALAIDIERRHDESPDGLRERIDRLTSPLDALLREAPTWPEAVDVHTQLEHVHHFPGKEGLLAKLTAAAFREALPSVAACPRCGVPEPEPETL
jgi:hypothetical protein